MSKSQKMKNIHKFSRIKESGMTALTFISCLGYRLGTSFCARKVRRTDKLNIELNKDRSNKC